MRQIWMRKEFTKAHIKLQRLHESSCSQNNSNNEGYQENHIRWPIQEKGNWKIKGTSTRSEELTENEQTTPIISKTNLTLYCYSKKTQKIIAV